MPLPQKRLIPGILLALMIAAIAAPPFWWSEGDPPVIDPAAAVNNHGPANIGQAKHMAKSALDALRTILPTVADEIEADLVGNGKPIPSWAAPVNQSERDKNHAPLLIGQLKAIADPFYTHIHAVAPTWLEAERNANGTSHPGSIFPWTAVTTDDANKAIANIGQLKAVFSLRFNAVVLPSSDDSMPRLAVDGALSVKVMDAEGNGLAGIPLVFTRVSGDGGFPGGSTVVSRSSGAAGVASISDYISPEGDVIRVTLRTQYGEQSVWLPANISSGSYLARNGSGGLIYTNPAETPVIGRIERDYSDPVPLVYNMDHYLNYVSTLTGYETTPGNVESYTRRESYICEPDPENPVGTFDPIRDGQTANFFTSGSPSQSRLFGFLGQSYADSNENYTLDQDVSIYLSLINAPDGYEQMAIQYGYVIYRGSPDQVEYEVEVDGGHDFNLVPFPHDVNLPIPQPVDGVRAQVAAVFGPFVSSNRWNYDPFQPNVTLPNLDTFINWDELGQSLITFHPESVKALNISFLRSTKLHKTPSGSPETESIISAGLVVRASSSNQNIGVFIGSPSAADDQYGMTSTVSINDDSLNHDLCIKKIGGGSLDDATVTISLHHVSDLNDPIVMKTFDVVVSDDDAEDPLTMNHTVNRDESSGPRYRKIALNGLPLSDEKPQSEDETDEEKEETYVDALTREMRHSTTDIYVPVPSSELALTVRRNAASESWSTQTDLYPSEDPTLAFGPGWRSNLTANVRIMEQIAPNATGVNIVAGLGSAARKDFNLSQSDPNYAHVTDEDGSTHRFIIGYVWPQTPDGPVLRSYLPAPNSRNESETYEMSLTGSPEEGFVFSKKHGNVLVFGPTCISFTINAVRTLGTPPLGFGLFNKLESGSGSGAINGGGQKQFYRYHRLLSVTDRMGSRINYTYDGVQDLVPSEMSVQGRPEISVKVISNSSGRIQAVFDAKGNETTYTYGNNSTGALSEVHAGGDRVAQYGYKLWEEEDYRMDSPDGSGAVSIPWTQDASGSFSQNEDKIQHYDLEAITDAQGNTVTFRYTADKSHLVTKKVFTGSVVTSPLGESSLQAGTLSTFIYPLSGFPPDVTEIILPDEENVLIGGEGEPGSIPQERNTTVEDAAGNRRTYRWPTYVTVVLDQESLGYEGVGGTAGHGSFFQSGGTGFPQTRGQGTTTHFTYYTSMEIEYEAGGKERYEFNTIAGSALSKITDADGNVTLYGQGESLTGAELPPLPVPEQNGGIFPLHNPEPTSQTDALGRVKRFAYGDFGIMETEIAATGNRTEYGVDALGRRTSVKVYDSADTLLSETEFDYHSDTPGTGFPGFMIRRTVKNTGAFSAGDPAWVQPLTTLYEPDANGRVHREATDMNGNNAIDTGDLTTTFTYDRNGNKLSATDPAGLTTWFHYDARHRITGVTYPDGTSTETIYDARGNKVLTRDERRIASGSVYDVRGRVTQTIRDMNGNLAWNAATQEFTGIDPGTDIISGVTYNGVNSPVTSTDPRGYVTKTEYDHLQRPIRIYTPGPTRAPGDIPDDAETDQLTRLFYDGGNSGGGFFNTSGYKPTKSIDPRGYVTLAAYDAIYRPVSTLSQYSLVPALFSSSTQVYAYPSGVVTDTYRSRDPVDETGATVGAGGNAPLRMHTDYDALFRPISVVEGFGTPIATTTSTQYTSTGLTHRTSRQLTSTEYAISDMEYDAAGRPVKVIGPEVPLDGTATMVRPETLTAYDRSGNVWQSTDVRGNVTTLVHDARNRLVQTVSPEIPFGTEPLLGHAFATTEYDPAGNPVKITDPRGNATETKYDAANRAYEVTSPPVEVDGVLATTTTATEYDLGGNVIAVTDGRGSKTINTYDPLSRLLTTKTNPTVVASTLSHADDILVTNGYDKSGNLITVTDGKGQVTSFEYDGASRKTKTIWDSNDPARWKTELTEYDAALAIKATNPNAEVTEFTYDARFRLGGTSFLSRPVDNITREYDLAGRLLATSYPNESPANQTLRAGAWSYDALDRLLTEMSNGITHQSGYDRAGNRTFQKYGNTNRTLVCGYDALNHLDVFEERIGDSEIYRAIGYIYDLNGNTLRKTLPNGTFEEKEFDTLNRARLISNRDSLANVISEYGYHFDAVGNVTRTEETYAGTAMDDRILTNAYDKANRLRVETITTAGTVTATSYLYDKANNRTEKSVITNGGSPAVWLYIYGNAGNGFNSNQLASYTRPDSTLVSFTYDANGNRATRSIGGDTDTYHYDQSNRLIALEYESDSVSAKNGIYQYAYDHRTRRVLRDETGAGGTRTLSVFSGGLSVQEYDDTTVLASLEVEYIRGSDMGGGIGGVLYTARGGSFSFNSYNNRGDVVGQTSASGTSTWQAAYEAFGTRTQENGSTQDRQKANTKDEDPHGNLNEGHRYRDLEAGIFLTRDPLGFVDGPNVYSYVRQNPWTSFDPLGLAEDHDEDRDKDRDENGEWNPNSKLYKVTANPDNPDDSNIDPVISSRDINRKNAIIWINGMNNPREAAAELGFNHTGEDEFYMVHNPSNGGLADMGECIENKLSSKSQVSGSAAEILRNFDLKTAKITAHSQGTMILRDAMEKLNASGVDMTGASIQLDGAAAHIPGKYGFGAEIKSYGANMLPPRGSPFDAVHNIVGLNTKNPAKIVGSLVAAPLLFANKNLSPHSTVEGGILTKAVQNPYTENEKSKRRMGGIHRR